MGKSPSPTILLRRLQQSDLPKLKEIATLVERDIPLDIESLQNHSWLAYTHQQQIVGFNLIEMVQQTQSLNIWLHGAVLPQWQNQNIGYTLINHSWQEIEQYLLTPQPNLPATQSISIHGWAKADDQAHNSLLQQFGLQPYHIYHELELLLTTPPPPFESPSMITIHPWQIDYCSEAVALRNRAFANSWGYQPTTASALHRHFCSGRYHPEDSFTAWQEGWLAGIIHCCRRKDRPIADIVWIAVDECVRGQGIGQALLKTAIQHLYQTGIKTVVVSSDSWANKPEIGLYQKIGFQVTKAVVDYQRTLYIGQENLQSMVNLNLARVE